METKHFKDRKRDENEVLGYYETLDQITKWAEQRIDISEEYIQRLHAIVMGDKRVKFSKYRDGQNVIREAGSGKIVYLPPEAKDVPSLMKELVNWIKNSSIEDTPDPIRASIVHYQFATIHPYYDGNGRTARLLTNLVLYLGGYDLNGIYSLEEYYSQRLNAYYAAISVGKSHNYYFGRAETDITNWIEYFCEGMAESFAKVKNNAQINQDKSVTEVSSLNARSKKLYQQFKPDDIITTKDLEKLYRIKSRTAAYIAKSMVRDCSLKILDGSKKGRKYIVV
jgi:Fic family protein